MLYQMSGRLRERRRCSEQTHQGISVKWAHTRPERRDHYLPRYVVQGERSAHHCHDRRQVARVPNQIPLDQEAVQTELE